MANHINWTIVMHVIQVYNQCVLLDYIPAYTVEWVILNKDYLFEEHVHRSRLGTRPSPGLEGAWTLVVVGQQETEGTLNRSLAD